MFSTSLRRVPFLLIRNSHNSRNGLLQDYRFTPDHEWVFVSGKQAKVGLTDHAQYSIGEIVFVSIERLKQTVQRKEMVGIIESSKAASDLYSPVSGYVSEINEKVIETPKLINKSPYDDGDILFNEGWIFKIDLSNPSELKDMMSEKEYLDYLSK
ncbi:Glycine cleavage system H protein, mitochondrial [Thelohanellus kitauei]|uniref:Glycine cleavage system H protein, mitochondrial n=1 Tax=Thelohanellus kitauei TaxID=669202 RepID=A0A0C2N370_THEKT|nr:Glycine cleavage system H protein, mitochondrial [Thelohanellus kitauei]